MAGNPFDAFDAPAAAPKANPFDAFDSPKPAPAAPPAAAASSADIAQPDTLPALDPRTATMGDYLAKLHQAAGGLGQLGSFAGDYGRVASNIYGEGGGLSASLKALYGDITGPTVANLVKQQTTGQGNDYLSNLAAEKAKTAEASQRLGTAGTIAASLTGGGPLASVGKGVSTAIAPYTGRWLGGVLGSGATTAGATAAGEIGRNEPFSPKDIGLGFGFGALSGVPGGVVGRGEALPTSPTAQSYFDQAKQAYKPLNDLVYTNAKSEVHPALDINDAKKAQNDWSGKRWDDADKTRGEVQALLNKPQLTADDLHQSQKYLRDKVINSPAADPNDQSYAGYYRDQLQHVLENGLPTTGVPQNLPPGVSPSNYAAYVKSQGDFLTGQARDMQRADVWKAVGATPTGKDIGTQAGSWVADQAGRAAANKPVWAKPDTPYFDAASELAKTSGQATPITWGLKHYLLAPLAFTAAGEGFNALTGGEGMGHQPWWARLGEEAGTGALLTGGAAGYRAYTAARNAAAQQAAAAAVRQTIASRTMQNPLGTYTPLAPPKPVTPLRNAMRTVLFGGAASDRLPGQ